MSNPMDSEFVDAGHTSADKAAALGEQERSAFVSRDGEKVDVDRSELRIAESRLLFELFDEPADRRTARRAGGTRRCGARIDRLGAGEATGNVRPAARRAPGPRPGPG